MIKATCTACGRTLGAFNTWGEYIAWRRKTAACECGASLDAAIYTSHRKVEEPPEKPTRRKGLWR